MSTICFADLETTGLDSDWHEPWELCIATYDTASRQVTQTDTWLLPLIHPERADPMALQIGGFWQRWSRPLANPTIVRGDTTIDRTPQERLNAIAWEAAHLLAGRSLIGANPAFDDRFLTQLCKRAGVPAAWHYRPVCIEAMTYGYLARDPHVTLPEMPWKADDLTRLLLGAERTAELAVAKHTALGDVEWAIAMYDTITGPAY